MLFSKNYLFTCVFILCSIPHAVLKSTSLCDPQSDLLKTISLSVQRPTAFHHRAIELEHSLDHEVLSVSNTLSQKKKRNFTLRRWVALAVWPLDLCKKASLYAL